ncbi:MAG: 2-amino-4-hydroxy-6-hydroxymethyldihydropteridine diphosphokinase [Pseudomonadota bacterium]|jgi:2-amino-4-hydroxy-6-hydroxymethyldihydropteridine diphosphokinase
MRYYIGFGSNVGHREEWLARAVAQIRAEVGEVIAISKPFFNQAAVLPGDDPSKHPEYLNVVMSLECPLSPVELMRALLTIERNLGRDRDSEGVWGDRTVDLDIVAAGDMIVDAPEVTIPHPRMHERDFVLLPLSELAPTWVHPVYKVPLSKLIAHLPHLCGDSSASDSATGAERFTRSA